MAKKERLFFFQRQRYWRRLEGRCANDERLLYILERPARQYTIYPADYAAKYGNVETLEWMRKRNSSMTLQGLEWAVQNNQKEVCLWYGKDTGFGYINVLHKCIYFDNIEVFHYICTQERNIKRNLTCVISMMVLKNRVNMLDYVRKNFPEVTWPSLHWLCNTAICYGSLDVLKWFHHYYENETMRIFSKYANDSSSQSWMYVRRHSKRGSVAALLADGICACSRPVLLLVLPLPSYFDLRFIHFE